MNTLNFAPVPPPAHSLIQDIQGKGLGRCSGLALPLVLSSEKDTQ